MHPVMRDLVDELTSSITKSITESTIPPGNFSIEVSADSNAMDKHWLFIELSLGLFIVFFVGFPSFLYLCLSIC